MKWSHQGAIKGMDCVPVTESADHHGRDAWKDNFICLPQTIPLVFSWSANNPIAESENCIQWKEITDWATWHDNYLCVDPKPGKSLLN
jgi:hypothetical protein